MDGMENLFESKKFILIFTAGAAAKYYHSTIYILQISILYIVEICYFATAPFISSSYFHRKRNSF